MKKEEANLYREIQKNVHNTMTALEVIRDKVYDKNLSLELAKEYMTFADIGNRALEKLTNQREESFYNSEMEDTLLKSGVQIATLFNSSTGSIANRMIKENNKGVMDICKNMHRNCNAGRECMELAQEFMDFGENNMKKLKRYL